MKSWTTWLLRGLVLGVLVMAGCAQQRAPINRVQPNAWKKSFFVGPKLNDDSDNPEFYARGFVIDNSAHQSDISVGLYTGTDRIKWQITKDWLIARKSYPIVLDQDPKTTDGKVDGTIVAKYKIEKHFDIKRAYNPQTGEPLNIVEENTTDRPWQERAYMRVDWSTNQVNNPMWTEMFFGKIFGNITVEPLTYEVQDPTNEDAPHFEVKDGYFDVTNKYYIAPDNTDLGGFTLPTCVLVGFYTGSTSFNCDPQEATVRWSYWKVKASHDFEPTENTKRKLDIVANFGGAGDSAQPAFAGGTTQCWDPQYGYSDACFHQYLNKLNLWQQSHQRVGTCNTDDDCTKGASLPTGSKCMPDHTCSVGCTSNLDTDGNGTADQCSNKLTHYTGHQGSQCDTFYDQCTIPLRDRVLQPQGYWLNKETPAEMEDPLKDGVPTSTMLGADGKPAAADADYKVPQFRGPLEDSVKSWNQLLTASIAYSREVECRRTAEDGKQTDPAKARADCHQKYFVTDSNGNDVTQMISFGGWGIATPKVQSQDGPAALVACHAPVRDYDYQPTCGKVTTKVCDPTKTTNQCGPDMGCNPEGHCADVARVGDLRKNFIFYWPWSSTAQYGGVSNLGADPQTGEEIGVVATIMGRSATHAAAAYRDYLQTAMGSLSVGDFTNGVPEYVYNKIRANGYSPASAYAKKMRAREFGTTDQASSSGASAAAAQGAETAPGGASATQPGSALPPGAPVAKPGISQGLKSKQVKQILAEMGQPQTNRLQLQSDAQLKWDALASTLRGTPVEAELVDPHWAMDTLGADPNQPLSSTVLQEASPLRGLDPGALRIWRDQISNELGNRAICYTQDVAKVGSVNFQGLARWYEDKFHDMGWDTDVKSKDSTGLWLPGKRDATKVKQRGDYIYNDLTKQMAEGITIHEMGHTLGMRHNFESSYDAINFMPQYWQLRTDGGNKTAMQPCNGKAQTNGNACMGPRFNDPETLDEQGIAAPSDGRSNGHPAVDYFGNTSVMEYEQDYLSPGIGPYDFYYTEAVYGGVLETYDIDRVNQGGVSESAQKPLVANDALNSAPFRLIHAKPPGSSLAQDIFVHYTQLARDMNVFQSSYCRPATKDELKQAEWRIIHGKVCTRSPRDRFMWQDFISDNEDGQHPDSDLASTGTSVNGTGWTFTDWRTNPNMPNADGHDHERWPYRYGETYSPSYLHTNYTDNGADPYEVVVNNAADFRVKYPTEYFRRHSKGDLWFANYNFQIPSYTAERFFERERSYHWILASFFNANLGDTVSESVYNRADQETFWFLTRAAMSPEPGPMAQGIGTNVYDAPDPTQPFQTAPQFDVGLIDGRYVADDFSSDHGGDWDYISWLDHAGFNLERGFAIRALVDSRPTLFTISRQSYLDGRNVETNFQNDDAQGLDRFLGGVVSEDWNSVAPRVDLSSAGKMGTAPDGLPYRSLQMPNLLATNVNAAPNTAPVNPNIGFKTELQTVVWADLFAAFNTDTTLINKMAIYVKGVDFVDAIPQNELISFTDPATGITYLARSFGKETINGVSVDNGIAARMLQHAIDLQNASSLNLESYVGLIQTAHEVEKDLAKQSAWDTVINTFY